MMEWGPLHRRKDSHPGTLIHRMGIGPCRRAGGMSAGRREHGAGAGGPSP